MTAVLAAATLALGVVVGAAIGPAPSPSLALGKLLPLLPALLDAQRSHGTATQPSAATPESTSPTNAAGTHHRRHRRHLRSATEAAAPETSAPETTSSETSSPTSSTPTSSTKPKTRPLPAVTKVWLIELGNSSFGELATHAATAPFLTSTALPAGTLLSEWSALDGGALANEAALIAGTPPQLVDTIVQPPCPEGAAGAACAADTPGALTSADEFLKAALPTITSTAAYRENGLVVVTFASVAVPTASGLPAGATNATLTSQPPTGVLLISPFVATGAKSTVTFDPTSPRQTLEKLLRR